MKRTAEAAPDVRYRYRAAGTSDEVTDCDLCGRTGLKSTVMLQYLDAEGNADGERYVGSDCAGVLLSYAAVRTEAELRLSRRELKDARAARRALHAAQAADLRRAGAVEQSRALVAHYEPFEAEGPGALAGAYMEAHKDAAWLPGKPYGEILADCAEMMARHRQVIATGGRSAL